MRLLTPLFLRRRPIGNRVRVVHLLILVFVTLPLTLTPISVFAESNENLLPPESGQGWFWDRPATEPPAGFEVIGDPVGQVIAPGQFAGNHLYVGWDAADLDADKREMISGVAFDLFTAGVPPEATITKFVVTIVEHSTGHQPTVNTAQAKVQGIVACPWSAFYGGSAAAPIANAPDGGGACKEKSVQGVPGEQAVAPYEGDLPDKFLWTFDLTDMMSTLWKNSENTAFSLEPNPDKPSQSTWITSFHSGAYGEPKDAADPFGAQNPKPGVVASISWVPGETIGEELGLGEISETPEEPLQTGEAPPVEQPEPGGPVPVEEQTRAAARQVTRGTTPFMVWVGGLLTLIFLGLAGWLLNQDPQLRGRDPGAASALIQGRS